MFALFTSGLFFGQASSGISISWNVEVGCQTFGQLNVRGEKNPVLIEDIEDGKCIRVCESSLVTYSLTGLAGTALNAQWTVIGGVVTSQTSSTCTVTWGTVGTGSLIFDVNITNGTVSKTICFEKIIKPIALFNVLPLVEASRFIYGCTSQNIYFTNQSNTNNGTGIITNFWDFGDNQFSSSAAPSHTYAQNGSYWVSLTVTNSCNCSSTYRRRVIIQDAGFDISCPTVVCEGATSVYTLPTETEITCNGNYNWTATGGTITNVNNLNGVVTILWNNVDNAGFGYVTFNPSGCGSACLIPTTIKIPVVKTIGTILGNTNLCPGAQSIYKLPQWPDTTFNWEIVGNVANNLATVMQSTQRNEVIVQPNVAGTFILRATYQNNLLHCGGTATFTINVGQPTSFTGPTTLCTNSMGTFQTAGGLTTWTLKNNAGLIINTLANSATYSYNFATAGGYTLSISNSGACLGQQLNIYVQSPVNPALSEVKVTTENGSLQNATTTIICPNSPYEFTAPADTTAEYYWTITNGTIIGATTGNSVNANFNGTLPAELKYYKQTAAPLSCRSAVAIVPIPIRQINATIASLGFSYNNDTAVCANRYVKYQANTTGTTSLYTEGETYMWTITPANLGSIVTGQNTNQVEVLWNNVAAASTAVLSLVIKKCTITASIAPSTITISPTPTITINAVSPSCSGSSMSFNITSTNGFTLAPSTAVIWNFGANDVAGGLTNSNTFNNIGGATNLTKTVTATIINPNGCAGNATAQINVSILPGPPAAASLLTAANTFCNQVQISATLAVSSAVAGVVIQWYKDGAIMAGQTGPQLIITSNAATGFGNYNFKATKTTSPFCATFSNVISIIQFCNNIQPCAIMPTPTVTNDATQTCNVLYLNSTATPGYNLSFWQIIGPNVYEQTYTQPTLTVTKAGVYNTFYNAVYPLPAGGVCTYKKFASVVVPYIADFKIAPICNGNNTFNVTFIDNSDFFALNISNPTVKFYYKLSSTTVWTGPVAGIVLNNLPAGSYNFKTEIKASYLGVVQPVCIKTRDLTLSAIPLLTISVNPSPVKCFDTSVKFDVSTIDSYTYLWHFETGAESTLKATQRVFSTIGLQNVWVDVSNSLGCTRRFYTSPTVGAPDIVFIPAKCFNGTVTTNPNPATVCKGAPVTLTYQTVAGDCAVNTYTWMNGQDPVLPASNTPSIQVYNPGFYWVNVKNASQCSYDTPTRISPTFKAVPTLKLSCSSTVCLGNTVYASITSNAVLVKWFFDGIQQPAYDNQTVFNINNYTLGNHTVLVTAVLDGCSTSASQVITISPNPAAPIITQQVVCAGADPLVPYYHVILTATSNVAGVFNWSNGDTGATTVVNDGGPYQVRITSGGCSNTAQTDVPYNPERFMWVFPSGCVNNCFDRFGLTTIIGPHVQVPNWQWTLNQNTVASGQNSEPTPLVIDSSGTYNLTINNGICSLTSSPLNYTVVECKVCPIERVRLRDIRKTDEKFCSFNAILEISSGGNFQVNLLSGNNDVVLVPASLAVTTGTASYAITIIPITPFTGGVAQFSLIGNLNGEQCIFPLSLEIPLCSGGANKPSGNNSSNFNTKSLASIQLAPNPAKENFTVFYNGLAVNSTISLFDLTGRILSSFISTSTAGNLDINTSNYPAGIYLVVVKENNLIVSQQKLVIE